MEKNSGTLEIAIMEIAITLWLKYSGGLDAQSAKPQTSATCSGERMRGCLLEITPSIWLIPKKARPAGTPKGTGSSGPAAGCSSSIPATATEKGELGVYFPGLSAPPLPGTPILDKIEQRLSASGLTDIVLSTIKETVWLPAPGDILSLLTFGQSDGFAQYARERCLPGIRDQFEKHAGAKGLLTTGFYYFIEATAT
ncbi:hypothetical protein D3C75_215770 [compost metagenome]